MDSIMHCLPSWIFLRIRQRDKFTILKGSISHIDQTYVLIICIHRINNFSAPEAFEFWRQSVFSPIAVGTMKLPSTSTTSLLPPSACQEMVTCAKIVSLFPRVFKDKTQRVQDRYPWWVQLMSCKDQRLLVIERAVGRKRKGEWSWVGEITNLTNVKVSWWTVNLYYKWILRPCELLL